MTFTTEMHNKPKSASGRRNGRLCGSERWSTGWQLQQNRRTPGASWWEGWQGITASWGETKYTFKTMVIDKPSQAVSTVNLNIHNQWRRSQIPGAEPDELWWENIDPKNDCIEKGGYRKMTPTQNIVQETGNKGWIEWSDTVGHGVQRSIVLVPSSRRSSVRARRVAHLQTTHQRCTCSCVGWFPVWCDMTGGGNPSELRGSPGSQTADGQERVSDPSVLFC